MGAVFTQDMRVNKMVKEVMQSRLGGCGIQAEPQKNLQTTRAQLDDAEVDDEADNEVVTDKALIRPPRQAPVTAQADLIVSRADVNRGATAMFREDAVTKSSLWVQWREMKRLATSSCLSTTSQKWQRYWWQNSSSRATR